jgi:DHA3 family macrolide efflux protein-like MFS transporter
MQNMNPGPDLYRRAIWLVATRGISGFGSAVTSFGLDVSVFQRTGSYGTFAMLAALTYLPSILLAPFIGTLVDRCNKKLVLIGCEVASALGAALALWFQAHGALDTGAAAVVVLTLSVSNQVRWTAMSVAISMLVEKSSLQRINGIQQAFQGVTDTAAPVVGALALQALGFPGLVSADIATYVLAVAALAAIPARLLAAVSSASATGRGPWSDAALGFEWIRSNRGLLKLLLFVAGYNLVGGIFTVAFVPYILSFASSQLLGLAFALDGIAAIAVGVFLARWKGPTRPYALVIGCALAFGAIMALWGWVRQPVLVCVVSFVAGSVSTLLVASLQTVWQSNVPVEVQGRVFAIRRMVSFLLIPVSLLGSIPFSERVLLPIVQSDGLAASLWGRGQAGAIGMMLSVAGAALFFGCLLHISRNRALSLSTPNA